MNSRVSIHSGISCGDEIRKNEVEILADFRALRDDIDSWLTEMFPDSPIVGVALARVVDPVLAQRVIGIITGMGM